MPYAVLVSILGAIVATAIALFGLQSWAALKIAPIVGAALGLSFALLSLRRYQLPLGSGLETYRGAAGVSEAPISFYPALGVSLIISLAEIPGILLGLEVVSTCIVGWLFLLAGTVYLGWRAERTPRALDVFQIMGGVGCLVIFGWIMYAFVVEMRPGLEGMPLIHLIRTTLFLNFFAAAVSSVLALFGLALISRLDTGIRLGR